MAGLGCSTDGRWAGLRGIACCPAKKTNAYAARDVNTKCTGIISYVTETHVFGNNLLQVLV